MYQSIVHIHIVIHLVSECIFPVSILKRNQTTLPAWHLSQNLGVVYNAALRRFFHPKAPKS